MQVSTDQGLVFRLKRLIIDSCDLDVSVGDIDDDMPLFGPRSNLGLDSIDALQISVAIQNDFGIAIRDSKQMRRIMKSVKTFADFIQAKST
jgi:acyl carrier protein